MSQPSLFAKSNYSENLKTHIECSGGRLIIPEGLHTTPCTHGLHRFPGKFIPNLPRYLVRKYLKEIDGAILDPFCGSGTSIVEFALEGKKFVGMDLDPLSVLISKAKATPIPDEMLIDFERAWKNFKYDEPYETLFPIVPNLKHWFTDNALIQLSSIKSRCLQFPEPVRTFALVIFSSIIRRVSNADDQTQKTYVSGTHPKTPPNPSDLFPVFLERALAGMREYKSLLSEMPSGEILSGDARSDIDNLKFSHVITSPPYIDSIDYMYNQMLEYFWLMPELGIQSYENFREMRKEPIGFRLTDLEKIESVLKKHLPPKQFEQLYSQSNTIKEKSPKESKAVLSFFYDYAKHLQKTCGLQNPGDYYICVIGNSFIRGITVQSSGYITELFKGFGYEIVDTLWYEIRRHYMKFPRRGNSGKIKKDFILITRRC